MPKHAATQKYLKMLKAAFPQGSQPASDYKIAQMLHVTRQCISNWNAGRSGMSDEIGAIVADMLALDPVLVLTELNLDRANSQATRQFYETILERTKSSAALLLLGFTAALPFADSPLFGI